MRAGKSWTRGTEILAKFSFCGWFLFCIFSCIQVFPKFIQWTPVYNHKKEKYIMNMTLISRQIFTFISIKSLEYLIISLLQSSVTREERHNYPSGNSTVHSFRGKNHNYFKIKELKNHASSLSFRVFAQSYLETSHIVPIWVCVCASIFLQKELW